MLGWDKPLSAAKCIVYIGEMIGGNLKEVAVPVESNVNDSARPARLASLSFSAAWRKKVVVASSCWQQ